METYGNICCKILNAFSTPVTHLKWSQKLFLLYIRVKFKLVWVTVNGYCLSWLLPVSDLDWGILGKKLHGIKWIFLNYKACNSSGSKYHLSVSSQRAREKAVKPDSERQTAFPWQSPLLLVFIMLEEAAADPDQLSLVSKLNGCKITAAQDIVLAPACNFRWQKSINSFDPFCSAIFPLWASHNSRAITRDDSGAMGRVAQTRALDGFPECPNYPFLHLLPPLPSPASFWNGASHEHYFMQTLAQKNIREKDSMGILTCVSLVPGTLNQQLENKRECMPHSGPWETSAAHTARSWGLCSPSHFSTFVNSQDSFS